jgi:amino-acid N-acetyltransferase
MGLATQPAGGSGQPRRSDANMERGEATRTGIPVTAIAGAEVRAAVETDVPGIESLIAHFARQNRMLFRTAPELRADLHEFFVARGPHLPGEGLPHPELGSGADVLLGVCGVHPVSPVLAEVRGLAIHPDVAARGLGRALVEACVGRARELGIAKVYTLTLVPRFFEKLGFIQVDRGTLSYKVWHECYRCPKFANCDETAMIRPLDLE